MAPNASPEVFPAGQELLDGLPLGLIVREASGCITYANAEAHRLLRFRQGMLSGRRSIQAAGGVVILESDGTAAGCRSSAVLAGTHPVQNVRQLLQFPDGHEQWFNVSWLPIATADGRRYVVTGFRERSGPGLPSDVRFWLEDRVLQTVLAAALVLEAQTNEAVHRDTQPVADALRCLAKDIRLVMRSGALG